VLVADINPGSSTSSPRYFAPVSNGVYFKANDGTNGSELWFSDGTAAGTSMVCDINPGSVSSNPTGLVLCAGDLFFEADDPNLGKELFRISAVGAYSQDLGLPGLGAPSLRSTAPVLGSNITFAGDNTPAGSVGVLVLSGHIGTPNQVLTSGLSYNWLDFGTAVVHGVITTPSWSITKPVPAIPALAGVQVNMQSWFLPGGAFPAETSNGLHLVVGN